MSKMSDLSIDIQMMLENGVTPEQVARSLNVPLDWVLGVENMMESFEPEDYCPFATVNS